MKLLAKWPHKRLGDISKKIGSGSTPRGGDSVYRSEGPAIIRSQNVYNGLFNYEGLARLSEEHADQLTGVTVEAGDVLLNITGDSVARCCQAPESVIPARVNQHVTIIRPNSKILNPQFLCYYLISPLMQSYLLSIAGSGGTRKALTKAMIEEFHVPCPSLQEQNQIVEIVGAYDDLIENNRRRMALLEESARLLYQEWFVRFRFPGHEHVQIKNGVPEGWERLPFDQALELQRGFDLPTEARQDGDIPIYGSTGIVGFHNSVKVEGPGLVTGRSGTLGEVHYISGPYWPLNTALWCKSFHRVTPLYALFLLREMDLKQYNGGASVPTLDRKAVHRLPVLVPPRLLISRFDKLAGLVFRQIRVCYSQNERLAIARNLLLPQLMSGEVAV